jgi:hypothetical protein
MATPIVDPVEAAYVHMLSVAAVLTAFPKTTLSGGSANRLKTAMQVFTVTPANGHIVDEQGDLLVVSFLTVTAGTNQKFYFTQKGKHRRELESHRDAGK